jgi:toxin ParE1/3/4
VKIRWTELAEEQFENVFEHIALDNVDAAVRTVQRIDEAIDRAAKMPYSGRTGQEAGTRELVVPGTPYIVVYRILEDAIQILSVWHGAQSRPKSL